VHLEAPRIAGNRAASTDDKPWSTDEKPGSTDDRPESTDNKDGSAGEKSGSTLNHSRTIWEKHYLLVNAACVSRNQS